MMHKGNGKPGLERPSTEKAAEWYAHNEVRTILDAEALMDWDEWASDPANREEYAKIAELRQHACRKIQPPGDVSLEELQADAQSELEEQQTQSKGEDSK
jgi:hypothetical protein